VATRNTNNTKTLGVRWIHKDVETDVIKTVEPNEFPSGYEIYWYRYQLGAPSPDQFAGAHWMRFRGCRTAADSNGDFCITEEELKNENDPLIDIATNEIDSVKFIPNPNN